MSDKERLEKVTLRLREGDTEELNKFYPNTGYNKAIRILVARHLRALKEKANQQLPPMDDLD